MNIGILNIGDELISGLTLNTNATWMAEELTFSGFNAELILASGDKKEKIIQAITWGLGQTDVLLVTGGLGPTPDDHTREALCSYFKCKMKTDTASEEIIRDLLERRGLEVTEINLKQAEIPEAAQAVLNPLGTSPGMWFEKDEKILVAMPGVPFEMKHMFSKKVLPALLEKFNPKPVIFRDILTCGLGESFLAERITEWEKNLPSSLSLAYLPEPGIIKLRLKASGKNTEKMETLLDEQIDKLYEIIPEFIFGFDDDTMESVIGEMLTERNLTVATAESCTGGYLAHLITSVPGSSNYYKGTVVAYENFVKINELNVQRSVLEYYGAVSEEVAMQMAKGIRRKYRPDYCIGITGIAGPDGGSPEKPVGTTWIAIAGPNGIKTMKQQFTGDRERNIRRAAITGLNFLRLELENDWDENNGNETK